MSVPPYVRQESKYTCSLAALRMALAHHGQVVAEQDLVDKIGVEYGLQFKNIWNPSIARLAAELGLSTTLVAEWPILKKGVFAKAFDHYIHSPATFNVYQYENRKSTAMATEPLPIAYKDLFRAVEAGCQINYGRINEQVLVSALRHQGLIQTSVKLHKMYAGSKHTFHSILVYELVDDQVFFHDPARGAHQQCSISHLLAAAGETGAYMIYSPAGILDSL